MIGESKRIDTHATMASDSEPVSSLNQSLEDRTPNLVILILLLLPLLFNTVALFPEATHSTPSTNDQVFHYLFIERADQAIAAGDNPFDHWLPELELGFPQFLYYQNLPHLMVAGLYRLFFKHITLIRLLNVVRYLLLVAFPLTVYWSMRRLEFSPIASAVGAALSPMLSSQASNGFDFHSYTWNGIGMFAQLWSMHLMFLGAGCVWRVMERGHRYALAIVTSSAMILSDLLYGYMFGILIAVLWLLSVFKAVASATDLHDSTLKVGRCSLRLALVAGLVALITAYQTLPFFSQIQYLNDALPQTFSPLRTLFSSNRDLPHLASIPYLNLVFPLTWEQLWSFFGGLYFDYDRLPVITLVVAIGVAYAAVTRSAEARLTLTMLAIWMVFSVPNPLRVLLSDRLPHADMVPFFRFVSGVDFAAILAAGLGGEFIWKLCRMRAGTIRVMAPIILLALLYTPLMVERWSFYQADAQGMDASDEALEADQDLRVVIAALKKAPPGRVYAGTRGNWGSWMNVGGIHLYDLLPIEMFETVMPWQSLSLNAPLLWQLNIPSFDFCRLFNIRYVVAPPGLRLPDFYHPALSTFRYVLYQVDSGGYMELGEIVKIKHMLASQALYEANDRWLHSAEPAEGRFVAYLSPGETSDEDLRKFQDRNFQAAQSPSLGTITDEATTPDSLSARVTANSSALLVIKVTYHPNWHVTVDGQEHPAFMVSPSYIGTKIEPGPHVVRAEYRSSNLKKILLGLSGFCLFATIAFGVFEDRLLAGAQR